ncbi:MAG: hypothetical protein DRO18_02100 [Thermoprotei archaeon]|nr:MAG: hypothetical protein DRO18_02100 [Thermoprotei archaeon]
MNPGPPGYQPALSRGGRRGGHVKVNHTSLSDGSACLEITKELVEEFFEWLRRENPRISGKTLRDYGYYIPRLVGIRLCGKPSVSDVFEAMGGLNKSSYEAFRRFLTFLEKTRELDELVAKLKKALPPKPKAREDTYVPPDSKILRIKNKVKKLGPPYTLIYNILVSSGCRCVEALYLIKNVRRLKAVKLGYGAVRVHVDLQRGGKNEFVMYLPVEVYNQVLKWRGGLPHEDTVEEAFRGLGLPVKYFRKWFRQKLKELGIDSEDIEALQGRVSSIGGRHYTDWVPILDRDYQKVMPYIRRYLTFS